METNEVTTHIHGYAVSVKFYDGAGAVIKIFKPFSFELLLTSASADAKCGIAKNDAGYQIRNSSPENAKEVLTESVYKMIERLEPFSRIEFRRDRFEIAKRPGEKGGYTPDDVIADIEDIFRLLNAAEENFGK